MFATIFSIAETILQKSRISQRNFAYLFPCLYYIGYLLPVTCLVLLQPVCKTLSPIQSRHSRHLQPVTCHRSLILLRCSPSGRRYLPNRVCWNGPSHSNVPGFPHRTSAFGKRYVPTLLSYNLARLRSSFNQINS